MYPSVVAIIPARGGSKGVPRKNIRPVNGQPLMAYTIEAALHCPFITATVVSSESEEILRVAAHYAAEPLRRPAELASDAATTESVIINVIHELGIQGRTYDYLCLLQPTSPLRTAEDLNTAFRDFFHSQATGLISVYEPAHTPFKSFKRNDRGYLVGLIDNRSPFLRRQDLPPTFMPNGAIYIISCKDFLSTGQLYTDKTIPYIMPEARSIDVDSLEDIARLEQILKNQSSRQH